MHSFGFCCPLEVEKKALVIASVFCCCFNVIIFVWCYVRTHATIIIRFNICTMCLRSGGETTDVEGRDYTAFALSIDEARRKRAEKDTKENPQQDICPRLQKKEEGIC